MALFGLLASQAPSRAGEPRKADVVVYGATGGGVIAAVAAAREGKAVILVEPGRHVGGMVSGGLGATDHGKRETIGGIAREFFRRVLDHYVAKYGADSPQVKDCSDGFRFEPHVAEAVLRAMLAEAKVEVVFDSTLKGLNREPARIVSIATARGDVFAARVFIDASYEGDLVFRAGLPYAIGREGRAAYDESIAGVQQRSTAHQWPLPVPAFGSNGEPLPGIARSPLVPPGSGDRLTQAYNYRVCMTDRKDNQVPFPRPEGYDPLRYELLARYLALKPGLKVGQLMNPVRMPNGKTDTNNNGPFSTDHIGGNREYPEAGLAQREAIRLDHLAYVQGFLYFLANDPKVPKALHDEMNTWGLAKDEFVDTGNWPHQLYVRECRRIKGAYLMTQADLMKDRTKPDSVGLGSYNTDSHHVQRVGLADGSVLNEGDFQVAVRPYAIPYRSLIPEPNVCTNLLVPVCLSASHVAYGSIRMEPVYMILGHACGVAASQSIDEQSSVQGIGIERLKAKLLDQKSVLEPPPPVGLDPSKMEGVVVDDALAEKVGEWSPSSAIASYVGEGYLHDGGKGDGRSRIGFRPKLPKSGNYEVRLYSTPSSNRSTKTPVTIHSKAGEQTLRIDQRTPIKGGGPIVLGVFPFDEGEASDVSLGNEGTDGHVIADAVQFVPVP